MNKRIKIIFPDGSTVWGKATTEHQQFSYGHPVIVVGNDVYEAGDISAKGIQLITTDREIAAELTARGYHISAAPKTSAAVKERYNDKTYDRYTYRIRKDTELAEKIKKHDGSFAGLVTQALTDYFNK